jgi:pyridoxamine 5'-phosphate oxidase
MGSGGRPGAGAASHTLRVSDFGPSLREQDLDPDPLRQFAAWFRHASSVGVDAPEAAALATASGAGAPAARMVLIKQYDERGFVFYSNYESRKGQDIAANPRAALLFYWERLGRQVRIEGPVERTTLDETAAYVRSRPRASQLSALASPQSRPIDSRAVLERRVAELTGQHDGADLPLPDAWGGFRVRPESWEFWQHRADRLHDRLRYMRGDDGAWVIQRLAP